VDDNALIATWVKWISIVIVSLILVIFASCQHTNYRIAAAIEHGVDPIAARCALDSNSSPSCLLKYVQPSNGGPSR
jgi:hypothetical protein